MDLLTKIARRGFCSRPAGQLDKQVGIKLSENFKPCGISNQPILNLTTGTDMDITLQIPASGI
jgi:hypothetical protein